MIPDNEATTGRGQGLLRRFFGWRPRARQAEYDTLAPAPPRRTAPDTAAESADLACDLLRFTVTSTVFPSITVDATCWADALHLALELLERADRWDHLQWQIGPERVVAVDPRSGERFEVPVQGTGWCGAVV